MTHQNIKLCVICCKDNSRTFYVGFCVLNFIEHFAYC